MKLQAGQTVSFNGHAYEVRSQIGSGAVSDVYLATLEGAALPAEVVIKLVHHQAGPESRQAQGARMEADVLTILNRAEDRRWANLNGPVARLNHAQQTLDTRRIVALVDSGIDPDGRVFLIQELAPPAFRRLPIKSLEDERALIGVAEAVARTIELAHGQGFALKDFEPRGEKGDRIRVDWDAPKNVKVIDWNITAGPNATTAEKASDLLYLGGHLYYFFIGEHIELSGRLPTDLGLGVAGWERLSEGSRQIIRRLLHRRYQSAREVRDDLSWWLATLALRSAGDLERRVKLAGERADRKLAVADLALHLELGPAERERFEQILAQAQRELERIDRVQLDQGIVNLRTGLYRKAVEEFERNLRDPHLAPELARQARLYRLQAQFAIWLRDQAPGSNPSGNPVWQLVNRAVEDMQRQQWQPAIEALRDAGEKLPALTSENPLQLLQGLAKAGLSVSRYGELQGLLRGGPQSIEGLDQWIKDERKRQSDLEPVAEQLRHAAHELAPHEPFFATFYSNTQGYLDKRRQLLIEYEQVERCLRDTAERRQHADALLIQATLTLGNTPPDHDPIAAYGLVADALLEALEAATRARQYATDSAEQSQLLPDMQAQLDEVRAMRASLERLPTIVRLIQQGEYDQALELSEQALNVLPGYTPARVLRTVAQTGVEWQSRAQTYIDQAGEAIRQRAFGLARDRLNQMVELHGQPLVAAVDRAALPEIADSLIFQLRDNDEAQRLAEVIRRIEEARQQVLRSYDRDHDEVAGKLEGLRREIVSYGYGLSDDEVARLDEAQQGQQRIQNAVASLARARGQLDGETPTRASALRVTVEHLSDDPTPRAQELRETAAEEWARLCKHERSFDLVYQLLGESAGLLSGTRPVGELRDLYEQAAPGAHVSACFPPGASAPPAWITGAERARTLADLAANLRQLSATIDQSPLLALHQSLPHWYEQLKAALVATLGKTYDQACALADKGAFVRARKLMREAWQTVPEPLQSLVPELRGSIESLIGALEHRRQLEQKLGGIVRQLTRDALSFGDAPRMLPIFPPNHQSVSLDDLQAFATGLIQLAELINAPAPDAIDAQWLCQLYNRHEDIADIEEQWLEFGPARKLEEPLRRLEQAAAQQAIAAAEHLCDQLRRHTTLDQVNRQALGQLFWTLAWWQTTTAERDPDVSALAEHALAQARAALYASAERVRDDLLRSASMADIEQVERSLFQIRDYNKLFADPPAELVLPANALPAEQAPVFDEDMLGDWRTIVEEFAEIGRAPVPARQPELYSAVSLDGAISALQTFSHRLEQLDRLVWPALFPGSHTTSTRLAALDHEAQELIDWANTIRQAHAQYRQIYPLITLQLLYQSLARVSQVEQTWPLDNLRAALHYNYRAVERLACEVLAERVRAILEVEDAARATELLRAELLEKATSNQLANSVEHAILDCIQLSNITPETPKQGGVTDRRLVQWQVVREATTNWRRNTEAAPADQQLNLDGRV